MTYVRGYGGQYMDYRNPEKYHFRTTEFAHALSKLCRFTGNVYRHYSVAQHSVLVSYLVGDDRDTKLKALLHDAAEMFIGDLPGPLKYIVQGEYMKVERRIETAIYKQFGILDVPDAPIKKADQYILSVERRDLIPKDNLSGWDSSKWPSWIENNPDHYRIIPLNADQAEWDFNQRAKEILCQTN